MYRFYGNLRRIHSCPLHPKRQLLADSPQILEGIHCILPGGAEPRPYQLRLHFNGFCVKQTVYGLKLMTLPLRGSWRAAPEGLQQAGAKSIDRCTPVCTTKFHCKGRCLHRPAQIAPVLREFSANSLYFLGRQSRRPLQRPPLSPVGADDSVRPQNVPVLRKSAANSQLPSGPMWASAPTGLPQIRTAL